MSKAVKFTKDVQGSPDGINVVNYKEGETCILPDDLADVFIADGVAEEKALAKPDKAETKAVEKSPENKAVRPKRSKKKVNNDG